MQRNNPFAEMLSLMREEGAAYNAEGIVTAEITGIAPVRLLVNGMLITADIYKLAGAAFSVGDEVAVQLLGERAIILGRVIKA